MAAQFIYKGKDPKKSLPRLPPETPKNWQFLLSHNHWSNQPIKLLQLDALDAYHLEYCTKVLGQTAEQAKTTIMVVLWDLLVCQPQRSYAGLRQGALPLHAHPVHPCGRHRRDAAE